MRKILLAFFGVLLCCLVVSAADKKKVGLFKDRRSYITDGLIKTLTDTGYATKIVTRKDIQDGAKLKDLDVIYLPGGWNAVRWAGFMGRKNLVDFVASGKGILAGAFRGGYARNCERPLFPEVGEIYRKANGSGAFPVGNGPLVRDVPRFYLPYFDHMNAKVGPKGEVFLVDSGGEPIGVSGSVFGGRYVIIGAFLGLDAKKDAMKGADAKLFLNCLEWLAGSPRLDAAKLAENRKNAELAFLRREKILDYVLDEQGPDFGPGIITRLKYELGLPLESRKIRLERARELAGVKTRAEIEAALARVNLALDSLARRYASLVGEKINAVNAMSRDELIAENPFLNTEEVLAKIAAADGASDAEKATLKNKIAGRLGNVWNDSVPKLVAAFLHEAELRERLFPKVEWQRELSAADKTLAKIAPVLSEARKRAVAEERRCDLEAVPELMAACASKDPKVRLNAVVELGRIGDARATDVLIKAIDDPVEKIRINAILALGWLRSAKAVPRLIEATSDGNKWVRRRAVQALGQIGDDRAVPVLLENMDNPDFNTAENAILALGWLKAESAVSRFMDLIKKGDRKDPAQRALMMDAVRALGHIGDRRALPLLEKLAKNADDFPAPRRSRYGKRVTNIYSTALSLGLQGNAELAVAEIARGGKKIKGIVQNDQLWRKTWFYGLKRNFNFFAGRLNEGSQFGRSYMRNIREMVDFLYDCGATGVHNAWGSQSGDVKTVDEMVDAMGKYDMRFIDVMPVGDYVFTYKTPYKRARVQDRTLEKAGAERVMLHYSDTPVFQGFWTEEDYPDVAMDQGFEKYLKRKYGADFREKLHIPSDMDFSTMKNAMPLMRNPDTRQAFAEFLEWGGGTLMEWWREDQLFLSGFRKGCAFTFNNTIACRFSYINVAGKAGDVIDAHGPESYQSFGVDNDLMIELGKNGERRPVLCEFYNWYSPSDDHAERGFAQHLVSGECFFNFNIFEIFKAPCVRPWSWSKGRWGRAGKIFRKARRIKEFLDVPSSAANVALVASERSKLLFYSKSYGERVPLPRRYYQNLSGFWSALRQSHIPLDAIWAESFTPEKLRRYKCLVLPDAKSLSDNEIGVLRTWVANGGVLIATGSTTLFDQFGRKRENYALADVFGVDFVGYSGETDPDKSDTWCFDSGKERFKAVDEKFDREKIRCYVFRDLKPDKSIATYVVSKTDGFLENIRQGMVCEYDKPLGSDRVKPTSATVLARFADGAPALTVNKLGKGYCYFWTPIYPGLCYVSSGWEMQANFKDFWPGGRELLAGMVSGGMARTGAETPVSVVNCPKNVFVNVKKQPERKRLIVHLINMDPGLKRVRGIGMSVRVPHNAAARVFYPDTDTELACRRVGDEVIFTPRDFDVHDMIAIQYHNQ